MGFAECSNWEYTNIWPLGNITNECNGEQTTDLCINMHEKYSRQRRRGCGKWNNWTRNEEEGAGGKREQREEEKKRRKQEEEKDKESGIPQRRKKHQQSCRI